MRSFRAFSNEESALVRQLVRRSALTVICFLSVSAFSLRTGFAAESLTGNDVVRQCLHKPRAPDQSAELVFTARDKKGQRGQTRTFIFLSKSYGNETELWSKSFLFSLTPLASKDTNYMRWEYRLNTGKIPDQWLFVPKFHRVRRLSMRDAADQTWGLIGEDLQIRQQQNDTHRLLSVEQENGATVYTVETRPQSPSSVYDKLVSVYKKPDSWEDCTHWSTEFFEKDGLKRKTVTTTWQKQEGYWIRDTIVVNNIRSKGTRTYQFKDARVNVDLNDQDFTERMLRRRWTAKLKK